MGTPADMLRKLRALSLTDEVGRVIDDHTEELRQLNIGQMMKGKDNKGELFTPKHSENPFFKNPGAGMRYAAWKHSKFPETPFDIPNFIITGYYHGSVLVKRNGDKVDFSALATFAPKIDATFRNTVLGLNPDSMDIARREVIRPQFIRAIAQKLGVSVN